MKKQFWGIFILTVVAFSAFSAETVRIKPLSEKITIDGKLSEKIWQRKADVDQFYPFTPVFGKFKGVKTKVFFTYDKNFIYVGAWCEEPEMDKIKITARKPDEPAWKDDAIEIFFAPSVKRSDYVQIVINAAGTVFDLLRKNSGSRSSDVNWNSNAICKTFKGKNFWSLEAAIPLVNLPVDAPEGDWKFHIARSRACKGESYTFIKGIKSFHDVSSFYNLSGITIPGLTLTVLNHDFGEALYGTNRARIILKNWSSQKAVATLSTEGVKSTTYIPAKATQVLHLEWEQPFDKAQCNRKIEISEGSKVLRSLVIKKDLGAPFIDEKHAVFFIESNKAVTVKLPLNLSSISQKEAQVRWCVRDLKGTVMCSGLTGINNSSALLRIFWSFIVPGRYKLELALIVKDKVAVTAVKDLRLVNSPFQGI